MTHTYHFISGMPRSGSTLLAALLRQNPAIHAAMTSPAGSIVMSLHQAMSQDREYGGFVTDEQRIKIMRSVVGFYYESIDKPFIIDTNRLWCSKMPLLMRLFPESKVICTVRNVAWVMDSMERIVRKNALHSTKLFQGPKDSQTVFHRVESLAKLDRLVGFSYHALKEACYGEHSDKILVVDYERLCRSPHTTLLQVYQFLGMDWFDDHDTQNVVYSEESFDQKLQVEGLHTVGRRVEWRPRKTILPPELFNRFSNSDFWLRDKECPVKVTTS